MLRNIILMMVLLSTIAYAAEIKGVIYDAGLDKVKNAIVEVDSTPKQRLVSKDGTYSFNLPEGIYAITATFEDTTAKEEIIIKEEGTFVLDLFLFPKFEGEDLDPEIEIENLEEQNNIIYILYGAGLLIIILIILYKYKYTKKELKLENIEEDELLNKSLEIIKKYGGRATQKDIRKELKLSEAKISLILTELEYKGKIKKIKKGRGNIIILQH